VDQSTESTALEVGGIINEQETEKREDKRLASDLTVIFNMLDRLVTMMRVYPKGHPLLDELGNQASRRFKQLFEEHEDSVDVQIGAQEATTLGGRAFFSKELSDKDQYLWYSAYADGLLRVTFEAGLTADEIIDLMVVINRSAQGTISSDDDTITLLWEADFEHIHYFAVEGFIDSGGVETFDNMTEPEAINTITQAAINPNGAEAGTLSTMFTNLNTTTLDLFTRMQVKANAEMVSSELSDADLAYAFGVQASTIEGLNTEWTQGVDLEYRLIEALLSIVRTSPASSAGEKASELIRTVADQLIDSGSYRQAVRVLELLHDRRELFKNSEFDPLMELIERLSDPLQLEALIYTMQKNTKERDNIADLLLLLGPSKVQLQILRLLADPERKVVAMRQLIELLLASTTPENEHQVASKEFVESPTYLRRILTELDDKNIQSFGPAPRLIRAALGSGDEDTLAAVLAVDHEVYRDAVLAEKYLVPLSKDDNENIRKGALERLSAYHPDQFKLAIRDSILAKKFKGRTHGELRFLMRVFLENDDSAMDQLRELLNTNGWMNKSAREFAKMAAAVLLEAKDPNALEEVKKRVDSLLTNPDLKQSYIATLQRYGHLEMAAATDASEVSVAEVIGDRPSDALEMFQTVQPDEDDV
jgi:hypothetical protein